MCLPSLYKSGPEKTLLQFWLGKKISIFLQVYAYMYVQKSEEIYKDALISFAAIMVDIWRTINFSTKYMNLKSQNDSPKNFDWKNFMLISKKFQEHEHNWGLSKKQIQTFINLSTAWKTRKVVFWKMLTDRFSTRTTFQLTFFLFRNIIKLFLFSLRSKKNLCNAVATAVIFYLYYRN